MSIDLDYLRRNGAIIKLQGREYTTHAGLLMVAHEQGLKSVDSNLLSYDKETKTAIISATADGERGRFTDVGDASPANVSRNIAEATIRMASTRAISRALRLYLGVGMTCLEELPAQEGRGVTRQPTEKEAHQELKEMNEVLEDIGTNMGQVERLCVALHRPIPANMTSTQRTKLVSFLMTEKGQEQLSNYKEA